MNRFTKASLAISAGLVAVMLAAPASASAFKYTHRLTISVDFRYDWSLRPASTDCGRSGSGFFSAKVKAKSVRVRAIYSRTANRFIIGVPYGQRGMIDLAPRRLRGSYEVANNAPWVGECAAENNAQDDERSGCGIKPLPKDATVFAGGVSRRRINARVNDLSGPELGSCFQPGVLSDIDKLFDEPTKIRPPSKRKLRRRSVTVEKTRSVRLELDENSGVGTGNAVRTVRLKFKRL